MKGTEQMLMPKQTFWSYACHLHTHFKLSNLSTRHSPT